MTTEYKIHWNKTTCGRCGGTGAYHCGMGDGSASKRTCWGCWGRGFTRSAVTTRNREAFLAWRKAERPTTDQQIAALRSGRFGKAFRLEAVEVAT